MQSLNAVLTPNRSRSLPAFRPNRQFGRQPAPIHLQPGSGSKLTSPSPVSPATEYGKVTCEEVELLAAFKEKLRYSQADILDTDFDTLTEDAKCKKLDDASAFVKATLAHMSTMETRAKARATMADRRSSSKITPDITKKDRDFLTQSLKTFHAQLCALDAALLTRPPAVINAGMVHCCAALIFTDWPGRLCLQYRLREFEPN
jgi:hypothetical protein